MSNPPADSTSPTSAAESATPSPAALWLIGLGASIMPLDFAVNVAFPAITAAFALPTEDVRWVALCYVFTYGVLMLYCGALGDRIGHARVFVAGLWLALLSFVGSALATSYAALLAARVLQGVAVALTLSCAPALVLGLYPAAQRTRALSVHGVMQSVAGLLAPFAGGAAMLWLGWAGVFWMRVPIVLLALALLPWTHAVLRPPPAASAGPGPAARGWWALMRDALHAQRGFAWLQGANALVQFTAFAVPLCLPYLLMQQHQMNPLASGAFLSWWALGVLAGSALLERLARRLPLQRLVVAGGLGVALGLALVAAVARLQGSAGLVLLALSLIVQGVALGLFQVAYADRVVQGLPPSARGVAGSLTIVTRTVGVMAGAVVWLAVLGSSPTGGGFVAVYLTGAALCAAGFGVAATRGRGLGQGQGKGPGQGRWD